MTEVIEFIKAFNFQTIIAIFLITWGFYHSLSAKIERHETRVDRMYEMFIDLLSEKKIGKISDEQLKKNTEKSE